MLRNYIDTLEILLYNDTCSIKTNLQSFYGKDSQYSTTTTRKPTRGCRTRKHSYRSKYSLISTGPRFCWH